MFGETRRMSREGLPMFVRKLRDKEKSRRENDPALRVIDPKRREIMERFLEKGPTLFP